MNRKVWLWIILGIVVIIGGRFAVELLFPPRLTDEQKIMKAIETVKMGAEQRDARAITRFIGQEFNYSGMTRKQFELNLHLWLKDVSNVQVSYDKPKIRIDRDIAVAELSNVQVRFDNQQGGSSAVSVPSANIKFIRAEIERFFFIKDTEWRIEAVEGIQSEEFIK